MKIRRFFGKDMREALKLVKEELGQDAVIMSNRKVSDGVELVAAYDKEPEPALKPAPQSTVPDHTVPQAKKPVPTLSEIIGDDGPDNLKALLAQQAKLQQEQKQQQQGFAQSFGSEQSNAIDSPNNKLETGTNNHSKRHSQTTESDFLDEFETASSAVNTESNTNSLGSIKEEIATLRHLLQHQVADLMDAKKQRQKPIHGFIQKQLLGLGLSYNLANQFADFVPADATERDAWRYVLQLMMNRLTLAGNSLLSQTGAVALMGPTGTGKTTTVAKLAARYAKKYGADSVAMITIDTYRIGAFEQLQTYGKIIGCVVKRAENAQVLADLLFQLRHKRMVFIDTAGFSQRDKRLMSQLEQLSNATVAVKRYLVLQANTQYPALQQAVQGYQSTEMDGCILTKLDECFSLGEALSIAIEQQLPLSFVTDGQQVPEDIKPADAKSLVRIAAKLYKKYGLTHTTIHNPITTTHAV